MHKFEYYLSRDDFVDIFPVPSATDRFAVLADGFGGHFHKVVVFLREQKKKFSKIWTYFKFSVYYLYFCRMMSLFDQILQNINEEIKILGEKSPKQKTGCESPLQA